MSSRKVCRAKKGGLILFPQLPVSARHSSELEQEPGRLCSRTPCVSIGWRGAIAHVMSVMRRTTGGAQLKYAKE
eukprot:1842043-Rhodomonas_salina.2